MNEKKKIYRKDDKVPSEIFTKAMYHSPGVGSDEMTCGFCDRLHLCVDAQHHTQGDDDDGLSWQEYCKECFDKDPDGTILHYDIDAVSGRDLNGINFVLECPCNGLSRYETFIWADRDVIRNYLKTRIDQEYEWAAQEKTKNKLANMDKGTNYWAVNE